MSAAEIGSAVGSSAQRVGAVGGTEVAVGVSVVFGLICPAVDQVPPFLVFGDEMDEPLSSRSELRYWQPLED